MHSVCFRDQEGGRADGDATAVYAPLHALRGMALCIAAPQIRMGMQGLIGTVETAGLGEDEVARQLAAGRAFLSGMDMLNMEDADVSASEAASVAQALLAGGVCAGSEAILQALPQLAEVRDLLYWF